MGAGIHHGDVGAVLVELDLVAVAFGVGEDEGEEAEVAGGIAGDQVVALELEEGEVAVVVLDAFAHQFVAVFGVEVEVGD